MILREPSAATRVVHDHHTFGLFPRQTWLDLLVEAGLEPIRVDADDPHAGEHEVFVAHRPA